MNRTLDVPAPLRIAVLCGGESAERSVSLESGAHVFRALTEGGHCCTSIDPAKTDLLAVEWERFDVCFVALHGAFGEDGCIQELLDGSGIPYTGSGAEASRLAFNKAAAKERFLQAEVPTPDAQLINRNTPAATVRRQADRLGYPLIVKPNAQGSSLGVSLVQDASTLEAALEQAFALDQNVLLETAVLGEEWTVAFLDQTQLPPIRISSQRTVFDYQAKYLDEETGYAFVSASSKVVQRAIEDTALRACLALGTRGLVRVDVRLDTQGCPYVLEVNTIPGMTNHSLLPKAAARLGWTMTDICERAVRSALRQVIVSHNRQKTSTSNTAPRFARGNQHSGGPSSR